MWSLWNVGCASNGRNAIRLWFPYFIFITLLRVSARSEDLCPLLWTDLQSGILSCQNVFSVKSNGQRVKDSFWCYSNLNFKWSSTYLFILLFSQIMTLFHLLSSLAVKKFSQSFWSQFSNGLAWWCRTWLWWYLSAYCNISTCLSLV